MLTKKLVIHLHLHMGCYYAGDIHSVFVDTEDQCPSFRIGVTIDTEGDFSSCWGASRIESALSQWNSTYGSVNISVNATGKQDFNPTYCRDQSNGTQHCHEVIYCYSGKEKKDRTVCLSNNGKFKRTNNTESGQTHDHDSQDLRLWC